MHCSFLVGDEQPNVIAEKVNLGRALTALDLEQVVLNNGAIPNSPLLERAALVKGMLQGMLDEGAWQSALQSVYTPQTTVRSLFDGDYESFKKQVIASAAARKEETHIEEKTREILWKNWTADERYELAMKGNLHEESFKGMMQSLTDKLSDDQKRQAHLALAQRYAAQGKTEGTYVEFMRAGAEAEVENLFAKIVTKPNKYDLRIALKIAEDTKDQTKRRARVETVLRHAMNVVAQNKGGSGFGDLDGLMLYDLATKHAVAFEPKEMDRVIELAVRDTSDYKIRDSKDNNLRLRWAQKHYKERPGTAYEIFKSLNHESVEVLEAARLGLLNRQTHGHNENVSQLDVSDVADGELQTIMRGPGIPLELRASIAMRLNNKDTMREMSQKFYDRGKKNKNVEARKNDIVQAYHLWFKAEGSSTDSYMNELRAWLVEYEVNKERKAHLFWLDYKDVAGHRQAYAFLMEQNAAFAAYDVSSRLYRETNNLADAALVQTARERAVAKNPEHAFKCFLNEKDTVGVDLAIVGIGEKYKLSLGTLKPFLDHLVQEKMKKE